MNKRLFWIDLETEGLDQNLDNILEVAGVITDFDLNVIDQREWLVKPAAGWTPDTLRINNPFVYSMHTANGLLDDVMARGQHFTTVGLELRAWVQRHKLGMDKTDPICGSSVHFDRQFIKHYWPGFNSCFSHRIIDVSSEKEEIKRYRPEWAAELAEKQESEHKAHRALPDVLASIEEFRFYRTKRGDL